MPALAFQASLAHHSGSPYLPLEQLPMLCRRLPLLLAAALAALPLLAIAQNAEPPKTDKPQLDTSRGDAMIAEYFRRETAKIADACLADIQTADDWNAKKDEYRRQLHEMLGLDPLPEKTDLAATVTGKLDHPEFTVEKLHFQSRPGLYVTGNLYLPKASGGQLKASGGRQPPDSPAANSNQGANAPRSPDSDAPRSPTDALAERVDHTRYPAILYVCGHGNVKKDGVSYGSKSHYQHHGAWFARNGYVCLVIDTLQLGEIEGIHHGTYRYGMWWWLNRGYTPAGVEAWNCVRALDYLQSRPEVDGEKLGVTGRSGGGAYSWWIAAIDERIKCAVPVAGITDLQNHVVDGCVEGHCDCMYMVNTYRWDYPQVAALVAPRPLLISNTDSDGIFPLDGVVRVFDKARRIYTLLGKRDQIGLNITSGGHKDTQELQVTAMRWFNHHLRGYDGPVTNHAERFFQPEQLKVFGSLPEDEINTKIHETFVAAAPPPKVPESKEEWEQMREEWMKQLREKCFRGWPENPPAL
ncbi:MAG TPA: prolyl oligopeptidase family serine peptidase, partial [Pirellulaceae bacterium]|nr:prolyl oligopeptidase family serine peptidase [Pirellulaceae bacterium]